MQKDKAFESLSNRLSQQAERCCNQAILDSLTSDLWLAYAKGKVATSEALADIQSILKSIPNLRGHRDQALARRAGTLSFKCHILLSNYKKHVYKDQRFEEWMHQQLGHPMK